MQKHCIRSDGAVTHFTDVVAETDYMVKKLKAELWLFTHEFSKKQRRVL